MHISPRRCLVMGGVLWAACLAAACTGPWTSGDEPGSGGDHDPQLFASLGAGSCLSCHGKIYAATTAPPHEPNNFSGDCRRCHASLGSWTADVRFTGHEEVYALAPPHDVQACVECHGAEGAQGADSCARCHRDKYEATQKPAHAQSGISTACAYCHGTAAWLPGNVKHEKFYPLVGKHETLACGSCHVDGVFKGTPRECMGCHMDTYEGTTSPSHTSAGFPPTVCADCHSPAGWIPATFAHEVFFPLTGKHLAAACTSCHVDGVYKGTPRDCAGCHRASYDATSSPNHAASGFPTECQTCHTTSGWTGASFNHDGFFPLLGKHAKAACGSCHVGGVYKGTPRECVGCHLPDYQGTTAPPHGQVGIPQTCKDCHSSSGWSTKTFPQHDKLFPITWGRHAKWGCADCHRQPGSYSVYTCTANCHTRGSTDAKHLGEVWNYSYSDAACLSCHPKGFAEDD